jgi:hypothetical protein
MISYYVDIISEALPLQFFLILQIQNNTSYKIYRYICDLSPYEIPQWILCNLYQMEVYTLIQGAVMLLFYILQK